ncbi:MAG: hypothetical protein WCG93_14205 [Paludibacter sp.]
MKPESAIALVKRVAHEQTNDLKFSIMETILIEQNINFLKRMFKNEAAYLEYMKTLCVLRKATYKTLEDIGQDEQKMEHPKYQIYKLTNDLIGALLQNEYSFDSSCNLVKRVAHEQYRRV